jgi:hypothetical protein
VLSWHVMPCGGSVLAEVRLRRQVVLPRVRVEGYHHLQVPNVLPGQRYTLSLHVPDAHIMRQILGVEVRRTIIFLCEIFSSFAYTLLLLHRHRAVCGTSLDKARGEPIYCTS